MNASDSKTRIFSNTNHGSLQPLKQMSELRQFPKQCLMSVKFAIHPTPVDQRLLHGPTPQTNTIEKFSFYTFFPENIASMFHKSSPSIASDLASEIILCNSGRKYTKSESGAIYLSLLQNNDELINLKKARKFNVLSNFIRKQINHYLTKQAHQNSRIHICCSL